ncbi:MAG: carbamoyltransferase N-terminal domain-containing protein, partial [Candidatus Uhrbacteria bacterium]|nr:carbamoyltransferase N-terminal domain-containing protein [Candidatus Uhrbacteria bacterium]
MFPHLAIEYCLKSLEIEPRELDLIVIDQIDQVPTLKIFHEETKNRFSSVRIEVINHHAAHAANAFFCSPFQEAAIMIYDGSGEKFSTHFGVPATETETLFYGHEHAITEISKSLHVRFGKHFIFTSGIGHLYSFITQYLGFGAYEEGKTMGLAPYGKPTHFNTFPESVWYQERRGSFYCNTNIRYPSTLSAWVRWVKAKIYQGGQFINNSLPKGRSFLLNFASVKKWVLADPRWFPRVSLSRPMRDKKTDLPDEYYTNFAYLVQVILEKILVGWAKRARQITRVKNLCISGGLGLNSVSNKKILDEAGFEDVWIQPACSDTGLALGLALYGYHVILDQPRFWTMNHAYMGRSYAHDECQQAMEKFQSRIHVEQPADIVDATARLLKEGKIIGWFQGGSEYGPRALGHRSMIGNACVPDMKDVMNRRVKHREWWRPFATSVLE